MRPLSLRQVDDTKSAMDLQFTLMAELPNKDLHKFRGKLNLRVPDASADGTQPATVPENGMPAQGAATVGAVRVQCGRAVQCPAPSARRPCSDG